MYVLIAFSMITTSKTHQSVGNILISVVLYCRKREEKTVCEYCGIAVVHIGAHVKNKHSTVEKKSIERIMNVCPKCSFQGLDFVNFKFHMMMKHNDTSYGTVRIYDCGHCDYRHFQKKAVQRHVSSVHGMFN